MLFRVGVRSFEEKRRPLDLDDRDAVLVAASVLEPNDTAVQVRLGLALFDDLGFRVNRVSVEHRLGVDYMVVTQVRDDGTFGEIADR